MIEVPGPADLAGVEVVGVGLDLVDVERMRRSLARTPRLAHRLFTDTERRYAESAVDPVLRFAARFAAKEAAMKALGVGLGAFGFHDVWVERLDGGAPVLGVVGAAADLARHHGVGGWRVTLSHTETTAGAVVLALRQPA